MAVEKVVGKNAAAAVGRKALAVAFSSWSCPPLGKLTSASVGQGVTERRLLSSEVSGSGFGGPNRDCSGNSAQVTAHHLFAAMGLDGHPTGKLQMGCLITALMATTIDLSFQCSHYRL